MLFLIFTITFINAGLVITYTIDPHLNTFPIFLPHRGSPPIPNSGNQSKSERKFNNQNEENYQSDKALHDNKYSIKTLESSLNEERFFEKNALSSMKR